MKKILAIVLFTMGIIFPQEIVTVDKAELTRFVENILETRTMEIDSVELANFITEFIDANSITSNYTAEDIEAAIVKCNSIVFGSLVPSGLYVGISDGQSPDWTELYYRTLTIGDLTVKILTMERPQ